MGNRTRINDSLHVTEVTDEELRATSPEVTVKIPYGRTKGELRVTDVPASELAPGSRPEGLPSSSADLKTELTWLAENADGGGEAERICRAAVLIHEETRHPFAECLYQAIVWERG